MSTSRIEKEAEEYLYITAVGYDMTSDEMSALLLQAQCGTSGAFKAISTAFRAGYTRGHRATIRGRIKSKEQSKRG